MELFVKGWPKADKKPILPKVAYLRKKRFSGKTANTPESQHLVRRSFRESNIKISVKISSINLFGKAISKSLLK
jgi:hypothetical protein